MASERHAPPSGDWSYVVGQQQHLGWSEDDPTPEEAIAALASMRITGKETGR